MTGGVVPMVEETCDKLMQLLNTRQYATFMHEVDELNPVDAAEFLTQLPEERLPAVFRLLKKDTAAFSRTCSSMMPWI